MGFAQAGSKVFWKTTAPEEPATAEAAPDGDTPAPAAAVSTPRLPLVATGALLAASVLLSVFAGPVTGFLGETADQLYNSEIYISGVLGTR